MRSLDTAGDAQRRRLNRRVLALVLVSLGLARAQTDVLTANYDNNRTNANLNEGLLNSGNVNPTQFGKLYSLPVDGQVYAQPLYVHGLNIPGTGTLNVLYVATMHNSVYAFNADAAGGVPLWQVNVGPSVPTSSVVLPPPWGGPYTDILHEIGILSTPVIDRPGNTIYLVSETLVGANIAFFLHALDLTTGAEKLNGPVEIQGSVPSAGVIDAVNGQLPFRPEDHLQRPGLLLANGSVYVGFGSHSDAPPWHGWIAAYNAADLVQQAALFCTTASTMGGGIWNAGRGLLADANGIYAATGNGKYDGMGSWGDSVIRLTPALTVADWFTPADFAVWSDEDLDFGSSGPILAPNSNLLIAAGKAGLVALLDRTNLGRELANNTQALQTFQAVPSVGFAIFNAALWDRPDGPILYIWGCQDAVRAFQMQNGRFNPVAMAVNSTAQNALPFSGMTVSSNGFVPGSGILWATSVSRGTLPAPGTLHAFDAMDVSRELWNSDMQGGRDTLGNFTKFANPTVANGKVYVPTDSQQVTVYGLLPVPGIATVVNAASFTSAGLAPGELIAIFGKSIGPASPMGLELDASGKVATSLGGVTVTFDGVAAPLLYAAADQINAVVPFAVAGQANTTIRVSMARAAQPPVTYSVTAPVSSVAPAIFAVNASGSGQGAILNSDLSVNSAAHPAKRGSAIALYATGGGTMNPGVSDGAVIPAISPPLVAAPASLMIGGQPAMVTYQGAAPGLVAGVLQINAQLPAGIAPGPAVPVALTIGSTPALNLVTIAVQ